MGRPRKQPDEQPDEDAAPVAEEVVPSGDTKAMTYDGPPGVFFGPIGAMLEPGEEYEVPAELVDGLNPDHWK